MKRSVSCRILKIALFVVLFYVAVAHMVFAVRNPHLTETQRFLRTMDAMLFRVNEVTHET